MKTRARTRMRHKGGLASALLMATVIAAGWARPANAGPSDTGVHLTIMETRAPEVAFGGRHSSVRLQFEAADARHRPSKPDMLDRSGGGPVGSVLGLIASSTDGCGCEGPGAWLSLSFGPETPHRDLDASHGEPSMRSAAGLAAHRPRSDSWHREEPDGFTIEAGYSMPTFSRHFSSMPYAGLSASGEATLGWRFSARRHDLDFALVAARHESGGTGHRLGFEVDMSW